MEELADDLTLRRHEEWAPAINLYRVVSSGRKDMS